MLESGVSGHLCEQYNIRFNIAQKHGQVYEYLPMLSARLIETFVSGIAYTFSSRV